MDTTKIDNLIKLRNKQDDEICISIILPLHKQLPQRSENAIIIKNAIKEAKSRLTEGYTAQDVNNLIKKLTQLQEKLGKFKLLNSIGIYLSERTETIIEFQHPVRKKVIVNSEFHIRDLILAKNQQIEYYVIALSANKTRLLKGTGSDLNEIEDENFPLTYEEQFQFADRQRPKTNSNYGKEESTLQEERLKGFYRHIDKRLDKYFNDASIPIILLGVEQRQIIFRKITKHNNLVVANEKGNFDHYSTAQIQHLAQGKIMEYEQHKIEGLMQSIVKESTSNQTITGIEPVWRAINKGLGKTLLVDVDYEQPGYLDEVAATISLNSPNIDSWQKTPDLVEKVIEKIIDGNGEVIFLPNGKLDGFQNIVLMDR